MLFSLLEAVYPEFNGEEKKPGSFSPHPQICFSLPHFDFIFLHPSSLRSQAREE